MPSFIYSQLFITPAYPKTPFTGKTVIVTGSNVGLGKEAVRHFVRLNAARVILAVRNVDAGEEARREIAESTGRNESVMQVWPLDLSSFDSVKQFAKRANDSLDRIDAVVENAGLITPHFSLAEGYERSVTINVINTFYLALLLLPKLEKTAKTFDITPVLTIVTSEVHAWASFPERHAPRILEALNDVPGGKLTGDRYQTTKLLEVLLVRQIAPLFGNGGNVTLNMVNPGLCHSQLGRDAGMGLAVMKFFLARTTEVGSRTLLAGASAGKESHGKYITNGIIREDMVSPFVKSNEGQAVGEKVWQELQDILKQTQPDVLSVLSVKQ